MPRMALGPSNRLIAPVLPGPSHRVQVEEEDQRYLGTAILILANQDDKPCDIPVTKP
jgi:hypothetical protein